MQNKRSQISIGKKIFLQCLSVFIIFIISAIFLVLNIITPILIKPEIDYMEEQVAILDVAFANFMNNTTMVAQTSGLQTNVSALFNSNSQLQMQSSSDMMQAYLLNYIIIQNSLGEEIYSENVDYSTGEILEFSEELNFYISDMTKQLKERQGLNESGQYVSIASLVELSGESYAFVVMPVLEGTVFIGTMTYGSVLNNDFFRNLIYTDSLTYEAVSFANDEEIISYVETNNAEVWGVKAIEDSRGEFLKVLITRDNAGYIASTQLELLIYIVILFVVFMLLMKTIFNRVAIRPIAEMADVISNNEENIQELISNKNLTREMVTIFDKYNSMKNAQTDLEEITKRYNKLINVIDNISSQICINDPETFEITYVNKSLADKLNLTKEEIIGKNARDIFEGNFNCADGSLDVIKNTADADMDMIAKYGDDKYYLISRKLIEIENENAVYLQMATDVSKTLRKKTEIKKRLQTQELMTAVTTAFIASDGTELLLKNILKLVGESLGLSKTAVLRISSDKKHMNLLNTWSNPDEGLRETSVKCISFDNGDIFYDEFAVNKKPYTICEKVTTDERYRFIKDTGIQSVFTLPIIVENSVWGLISLESWQDERKWTEHEVSIMNMLMTIVSGLISREYMEDKLKIMSEIVNNSPQIMAYIRFGGEIAFANEATERVTGYSHYEMENMSAYKFFDEKTFELMKNEYAPRTHNGENIQVEVPIITKSGEMLDMLVSIFSSPNSHDPGFGLVAVDITEKTKMENSLIAAKEEAIASSLAKSTFLSRMSHEMRTPMNAIIGMNSIALMADEIDRKNYCLNKIDLASKHLLGVINDILDMSKIEANKFELSYIDFTLEKMLIKVTNVINFRVDEKKQDLVVRVDPDVPVAIVSDEQHLNQVLTNLLSNAVKFTPEEGKITLDVAVIEEVNGVYTLRFEVKDTGIGVTPEQKDRLFNSFEQADGSISRKFGGTGLGLAISKTIVELMDGEIWIESEYGKGSSFIFTIKAAIGQDGDVSALNPDINWENMKILVVDDSVEVREYFEVFAQAIAIDLMVVEDGYEALDLMDSTEGIFIVFVDWKMPKMNGIELAEKIKNKYGDSIMIIMISGVEWDMIEEEAKEAGVQKFIQKPLFASNITDCLNECLGSRNSKDGNLSNYEDEVVSFKGHKILMAEDVEVNREIVISLLEDTEIEIECAENGLEAVEMFTENPDKYDMIFMDIHMPEMGGFDATETIRKLNIPRAANIPIVAMTANVFREDIDECLAAGMDDHVGKPIDIDDVIEKIKKYIR